MINDDPFVLTMIVIEEDTPLPYDDAIKDAKLPFPMIMVIADPLLYPAMRPRILHYTYDDDQR